MANNYDVIIIGSGPSGLGAAFKLADNLKNKKILLIDKNAVSSGGLRNDCKQNYTFPVGFASEYWDKENADKYLEETKKILKPTIETRQNIEKYTKRAEKLGVRLLEIEQAHVGTDNSIKLINDLINDLKNKGVDVFLNTEVLDINENGDKVDIIAKNHSSEIIDITASKVIIAPGRGGAEFLQNIMDKVGVKYIDNIVDIGIRVETKIEHYEIVKDYYDPKFYFPNDVRTFCTNSGDAHIVQEKYENYYSVNGHAFSKERASNGLVNFAMLKTIKLTEPLISGYKFANILGQAAMQLSGGKPMMQRVGDFRMGKRSKIDTFNKDLYNFEASLSSCTPGDITLAMPSKIMRDIWKSLKMLDTIVPGVLHPSTILYYPEIKTYGNKPSFLNNSFKIKDNIYTIGDGAGTSRGITGAWASGIRAAEDVIKSIC
ncbi:MAG: NAD(P)/FAD-dependent oxidoreductase [Patescibacteria group bacterium]